MNVHIVQRLENACMNQDIVSMPIYFLRHFFCLLTLDILYLHRYLSPVGQDCFKEAGVGDVVVDDASPSLLITNLISTLQQTMKSQVNRRQELREKHTEKTKTPANTLHPYLNKNPYESWKKNQTNIEFNNDVAKDSSCCFFNSLNEGSKKLLVYTFF